MKLLTFKEFIANQDKALENVLNFELSARVFEEDELEEMNLRDLYGLYKDRTTEKFRYLAIWGEGFPNTYQPSCSIMCLNDFSEAGYDNDRIQAIAQLDEGQSYVDDHGGHWIIRLPKDFDPELLKDIQYYPNISRIDK